MVLYIYIYIYSPNLLKFFCCVDMILSLIYLGDKGLNFDDKICLACDNTCILRQHIEKRS